MCQEEGLEKTVGGDREWDRSIDTQVRTDFLIVERSRPVLMAARKRGGPKNTWAPKLVS